MGSMTQDRINADLFDEVKRLQRGNRKAVRIAKALAGRLKRLLDGKPTSHGVHALESHSWCTNSDRLIRQAKQL